MKRLVRPQTKTIDIACQGATTIDIDELEPFQGNLKTLTEDSYQKLRQSILTLGFSFPVDAWKDDKIYILDAHQRVTTLKRMRDEEGYKIPKLPVNWVFASNKKEAAKKLLAAVSQYGDVKLEGFANYVKAYKLDVNYIAANYKIPEFDMSAFLKSMDAKTREVSFTAKDGGPRDLDLKFTFKLEVEFDTEKELQQTFEELTGKGFRTKVLSV